MSATPVPPAPTLLPLREPLPEIIKAGRNLDAGQGPGSYSDPVYGHENDDVIWRIEVRNNGLADLQDFKFSDSMIPGNFEDPSRLCQRGRRDGCGERRLPGPDCMDGGGTTDVLEHRRGSRVRQRREPLHRRARPGQRLLLPRRPRSPTPAPTGSTASSTSSGAARAEPPAGGIAETSTGITAGDSALLSTRSVEDDVDVDRGAHGHQHRPAHGQPRAPSPSRSPTTAAAPSRAPPSRPQTAQPAAGGVRGRYHVRAEVDDGPGVWQRLPGDDRHPRPGPIRSPIPSRSSPTTRRLPLANRDLHVPADEQHRPSGVPGPAPT